MEILREGPSASNQTFKPPRVSATADGIVIMAMAGTGSLTYKCTAEARRVAYGGRPTITVVTGRDTEKVRASKLSDTTSTEPRCSRIRLASTR